MKLLRGQKVKIGRQNPGRNFETNPWAASSLLVVCALILLITDDSTTSYRPARQGVRCLKNFNILRMCGADHQNACTEDQLSCYDTSPHPPTPLAAAPGVDRLTS
jgi:hypothetical protein